MSLYTQASNGKRFDVSGVDPSTGLYSHRIPILTLSALDFDDNDTKREFSISYNCMGASITSEEAPFGVGWSLDGASCLVDNKLTISTGQQFEFTGYDDNDYMTFADRKTVDFQVLWVDPDNFTIYYKDGVVECLKKKSDNNYYLSNIIFPNGENYPVSFMKTGNVGYTLLSVVDSDESDLLRFTYDGNRCQGVTVWNGHASMYRSIAVATAGDNTKLWYYSEFAKDQESTTDRVSFTYSDGENKVENYLCLTESSSTRGSSEKIKYSSSPHMCKANGTEYFVPRVGVYQAYPGAGQKSLFQYFTYPYTDHNFMGYPNTYSSVDYSDTLYNWATASAYSYWVTVTSSDGEEGSAEKVITSTYNAFHLQTSEICTLASSVEETNFTYVCDSAENAEKKYAEQPANLLNPVQVEKRFYKIDAKGNQKDNAGSYVSTFEYDSFGNQLSTNGPLHYEYDVNSVLVSPPNSMGITQSNEYHPATVDPFGLFQRYVKTTTKTGSDGALKKVTQFTYQECPVISGTTSSYVPFNMKPLQMTFGDGTTTVISVDLFFDNTPDQRYTHNQISKLIFTQNNDEGISNVKSCVYTNSFADNAVTKTKTITANDGTSITYSSTKTVFSSLVTKATDRYGVSYTAAYDNTGKPTSVTNNAGTDYEQTETFTYDAVATETYGPSIVKTEPTGVKTILRLDGTGNVVGAGRTLRNSLTEPPPEYPTKDPTFYLTMTQSYDEYGRMVSKTEHDYDPSGVEMYSSNTTISYDGWGHLFEQTTDDGVVVRIVNDPVKLKQTQTSVILDNNGAVMNELATLETTFSTSKKPVKKVITRTDAQKSTVTTTYTYDGLDRVTGITSPLDQTVSLTSFDLLDRLLRITDPINRNISVEYSPNSPKDHVTKINLLDDLEVNVACFGECSFDGLGRLVSRTKSDRVTRATFDGSGLRPTTTSTSAGNKIECSYSSVLRDTPVSIKEYVGTDASATLQTSNEFTYGSKTTPGSCAKLLSATNGVMSFSSTYTTDGQMQAEGYETDASFSGSTVNQTCSLLGKFITQTLKKPDGDTAVSFTYDGHGRLLTKTQGDVVVSLAYDLFGRLNSEKVSVSNVVKQTTTIELDDLSRETKRTIQAGDAGDTLVMSYGYDDTNKMTSRSVNLREAESDQLVETFTYDAANRLTLHEIADGYDATFLPSAAHGEKYISQAYSYDDLDRITSVTSSLQSGGLNEATFTYTSADGHQIESITNSSIAFPSTVSFSYDLDGNLVTVNTGEKTISMTHSVSGRLLSYSDGTLSKTFKYDAFQRLVCDGDRTRLLSNGQVAAECENSNGTDTVTEFVRSGSHVVAEKSDLQTLCIGSDRQLSAIASHTDGTISSTTYSPYGYAEESASRTGFAGELKVLSPAIYALGNGTRFYIPELQMFCSPDGFVPFSHGGINPYLYCRGDPLNSLDPTGHFSVGLDLGLNIFSFIVDAIAIGLAVASMVATGGATAPAVVALAGAVFGVTSDVLGIAADSMAINDSKNGTDRSSTIQNLGTASAAFGLASMAMGGLEGTPPIQNRSKSAAKHQGGKERKARDIGHEWDRMADQGIGDMAPECKRLSDKYTKKADKYQAKQVKYFQDEITDIVPFSDGKAGWSLSTFAGVDFDSINKASSSLNPTRRRVKYGAWAATEFVAQAAGFALLVNYGLGTYSYNHPPPAENDASEAGVAVDTNNQYLVHDSMDNGYPMM